MARITDIIATVTNALAGIKPGDQVPLTAIVNPDGSSFSGAGGGGSTPSATLSVQRATGTGATAALASTATSARRTIRNTSAVAMEFGPQGFAFGAGQPLPAGESFTFDDTGKYTGDIYGAAAAGATWTTSTVSY